MVMVQRCSEYRVAVEVIIVVIVVVVQRSTKEEQTSTVLLNLSCFFFSWLTLESSEPLIVYIV